MKTMLMILTAGYFCATLPTNAAEGQQMTEEQARELADKLAEQAKMIYQRLEQKSNEIQDLMDRGKELVARMDAAEKRIRVKFAPKMSDDADLLWGKYKRFMAVGINDAAVEVIKVLRKKRSSDFPPRVCDVGEMAATRLDKLPFKGGVVATGFEPPATSHAIFKIGDIVTEIDGAAIKTYDDYKARNRVGARYTIYRLEGCVFKKHECKMPPDQPRVGWVEVFDNL